MLAARRKVESKSSECTQQLFTASNKKSAFFKDLCKALMTANIPKNKISNIEFRKFFEKYTLHAVPSESTLWKTYINDCYDECMSEIRQYITGNKIWVSIDETTDVEGRYIDNVLLSDDNYR